MFRRIVRHFGPEWGAAVMGTAALSVTMQLTSEVVASLSGLLYVGVGFYLLATLMFLTFLVPWTLRFFWYPGEVKRDLQHPVRGNFFPTMPISLILAGTGTNKLGPLLFGPTISYHLSVSFFFLGALGIFVFGLLLVRTQFLSNVLRPEHVNFAWFIPPVSHLIIPVLGACSMDVHWADSPLAPLLFLVSMVALGIGLLNFLFVGAVVWQRYTYEKVPPGTLAPTTTVGIAPTAIIVVFAVKFIEAIEASHGALFGISFVSVVPVFKIASSILWGFSAWWLVVIAILSAHYITMRQHPLAFGWWGYTFPLEAFAVATGLLAKIVAPQYLHPTLIALNALVLAVWILVVFGSIRWLETGAFFHAEHYPSEWPSPVF